MEKKTIKYSDIMPNEIDLDEEAPKREAPKREKEKPVIKNDIPTRRVREISSVKTKAKEKEDKEKKVVEKAEKTEKIAEKKAEIETVIKKNAETIKSTVENGTQINVGKKEIKISKHVFAVIFLVLFCGILLAAGFIYTNKKITKYEDDKKNGALAEVFPEAVAYSAASYNYSMLVSFLEDKGLEYTDVIVNKIVYARDEKNAVKGLIIYVECYKKFGGIIKLAVGLLNNGTITDYCVLDVSDAKGLDLGIKDETFRSQFIGKCVPQFKISYNPEEDYEVYEITGASDASYAVVNGINASIYALQFIDESMGGLLG